MAFDPLERTILARRLKTKPPPKTLQDYIICLAKLGGYLDRKNDTPPGATVIWLGRNKLSELKAGFDLALIWVIEWQHDRLPPSDPKSVLHSKRANLYYLQHCRVLVNGGRVEYVTDEGKASLYWNIPIANTTEPVTLEAHLTKELLKMAARTLSYGDQT